MLEALATAAEKIAETTGELIEKAAEFAAEVGEKINVIDLDSPVSFEDASHLNETEDLFKRNYSELPLDLDLPISEKMNLSDSLENRKNIPSEKIEEQGLSEEEKEIIKKETGYSYEIINNISSIEEAMIYKNAGLVEETINGKKCLINPNVDVRQKDEFGLTNKERMEKGLSPISKENEIIELHHIGQKPDSPLAELTTNQHRGKEADSILHNKNKESEINRNIFNTEKKNHWKARANEA